MAISHTSTCMDDCRHSQDFATSSLKGEVAVENESKEVVNDIEVYEIAERKQWEQR